MDLEALKKLDMRWMNAMNSRDLAEIDRATEELYPDEWLMHNPTYPDLPHTKVGMKEWARYLLNDMPDFHIQLEDIIAEGDRVASRVLLTGTNATSKEPFKMQCMHISRYAENKLVEEWEIDFLVPQPAVV
jgi:predicted SnoaL-like aldol condensation-catalyzing enzyme